MKKSTVEGVMLIVLIFIAGMLNWSALGFTGFAERTTARYIQMIAVSLGVAACIQLGFLLWKHQDQELFYLVRNRGHFMTLLIALVLLTIFIPFLGFYGALGVFMPLVAYDLGYRKSKIIILVTASFLIFAYLVFSRLFGVDLPMPGFTIWME